METNTEVTVSPKRVDDVIKSEGIDNKAKVVDVKPTVVVSPASVDSVTKSDEVDTKPEPGKKHVIWADYGEDPYPRQSNTDHDASDDESVDEDNEEDKEDYDDGHVSSPQKKSTVHRFDVPRPSRSPSKSATSHDADPQKRFFVHQVDVPVVPRSPICFTTSYDAEKFLLCAYIASVVADGVNYLKTKPDKGRYEIINSFAIYTEYGKEKTANPVTAFIRDCIKNEVVVVRNSSSLNFDKFIFTKFNEVLYSNSESSDDAKKNFKMTRGVPYFRLLQHAVHVTTGMYLIDTETKDIKTAHTAIYLYKEFPRGSGESSRHSAGNGRFCDVPTDKIISETTPKLYNKFFESVCLYVPKFNEFVKKLVVTPPIMTPRETSSEPPATPFKNAMMTPYRHPPPTCGTIMNPVGFACPVSMPLPPTKGTIIKMLIEYLEGIPDEKEKKKLWNSIKNTIEGSLKDTEDASSA